MIRLHVTREMEFCAFFRVGCTNEENYLNGVDGTFLEALNKKKTSLIHTQMRYLPLRPTNKPH